MACPALSVWHLLNLRCGLQTRVMAELERYAELSREKDLLNERWDEQHTLLVESHERVVQEITEEYEARLQVSLCDCQQQYAGDNHHQQPIFPVELRTISRAGSSTLLREGNVCSTQPLI